MSQRIASHPKMRVDSDTGSLNFFSGYSFQVHHGNQRLQEILDTHTDPWGIKVALVELKGWICPSRCSVPWHDRLKPNARSVPR